MSEYIVEVSEWVIDANGNPSFGKCEQIVRCRDCRFRAGDEAEQLGVEPYLCYIHTEVYNPDYFCADGERKVEQ